MFKKLREALHKERSYKTPLDELTERILADPELTEIAGYILASEGGRGELRNRAKIDGSADVLKFLRHLGYISANSIDGTDRSISDTHIREELIFRHHLDTALKKMDTLLANYAKRVKKEQITEW